MSIPNDLIQAGIQNEWQSSEDYYVIDFASSEGRRAVERLLGEDDFAARTLLDVLLRANVRTVILQDNYVDWDHRACFARFLHLRHHDAQRRCRRLHFFAGEISAPDPLPPEAHAQYRGFLVLRPLPARRLGRSVLSDKLIKHIAGVAYLTCTAIHRVNIAGNEIHFSGVPWMEQDTLVSACASAATWIVSYHLSHRFSPEFRVYSTPEITDLASRHVVGSRSMPSDGLTEHQVMYALREMGYDPIHFVPQSADDAKEMAYFYMESGLPVLITYGVPGDKKHRDEGHVVTIVGHTLTRDRRPKLHHLSYDGGQFPFYRSSDFVDAFIIQDDSGGPFRTLELLSWSSTRKHQLLDELRLKRAKSYGYCCAAVIDRGRNSFQEVVYVSSFIFPLPPEITLGGADAERKAISSVLGWYVRKKKRIPRGELLFRTFLQRSNEFKQTWETRKAAVPDVLWKALRCHLMPKWVWVTEISSVPQFKRKWLIGHVLQDSNSHAKSSIDRTDLIVFHMPGELTLMRPDGSDRIIQIPGDHEFPHYARNEVHPS